MKKEKFFVPLPVKLFLAVDNNNKVCYYNIVIADRIDYSIFICINRLIKKYIESMYNDLIDNIIGLNSKNMANILFSNKYENREIQIYGLGIYQDRRGVIEIGRDRYNIELVIDIEKYIDVNRINIDMILNKNIKTVRR